MFEFRSDLVHDDDEEADDTKYAKGDDEEEAGNTKYAKGDDDGEADDTK